MDVLRDGEIYLYGTVGDVFFDEGFSALDVVEALSSVGRQNDVVVHINSGGGVAYEGAAIYSILASHPGRKTVYIEGAAASAASVIAMAGDEVIMTTGSIMMIHDPSGFTFGNSEDHSKQIEALETLANSLADIYAEKTGRPVADVREEMKQEVWLTAQDAVKKGYADKVQKKAGKSPQATAFDYRLYKNAPQRLVALATAKHWDMDPEAVLPHNQGEAHMAEDKNKVVDPKTVNPAPGTTQVTVTPPAPGSTDPAPGESSTGGAKGQDGAAATTETVEQITARIRAEERERHSDITAACSLAGKPEAATEFIAQGKTLREVVAALRATGGTGNTNGRSAQGNNEITARAGNGIPVKPEATAGWNKAVEKINARFAQ